MKNILLLTATSLFLAACASEETQTPARPAAGKHQAAEKKRATADDERDDGSTPPRIGMTREEVHAKYGRPVNVSVNSHGEVWSYTFNNFDGTAFIPYYGAFREATKKRNSSVIFFGPNGRVRDFNWNQTDPMGGSVWR